MNNDMRVSVLALDGLFDTGLASVLDTLAFANVLSGASGPKLHVQVVGVRPRITTAQGLKLDVDAESSWSSLIVVPALFASSGEELIAALGRRDVADACAGLRARADSRTTFAAACTSTFVLAEAGLLDGRRATTTWWLSPAFRSRFPRVDLDESRMVVESKTRMTAGAAMAHVDLALCIVRRASPALANLVARYLVVEPRPSQAPFIIPNHLAHADDLVERFERWVRNHLDRPFSLSSAALAVGASQRSLERRVRTVLGKPPLAFVQDVRVEVATHLLRSTNHDIEAVAARVGYRDGATLRALLRKRLGRGVREIRKSAG
jgi:transcriptional regulator GlxA family with amidase domain